jgi:hypothetical protein
LNDNGLDNKQQVYGRNCGKSCDKGYNRAIHSSMNCIMAKNRVRKSGFCNSCFQNYTCGNAIKVTINHSCLKKKKADVCKFYFVLSVKVRLVRIVCRMIVVATVRVSHGALKKSE